MVRYRGHRKHKKGSDGGRGAEKLVAFYFAPIPSYHYRHCPLLLLACILNNASPFSATYRAAKVLGELTHDGLLVKRFPRFLLRF